MGTLYDCCWICAKSVLISSALDTDTIKIILPYVAGAHYGVTGWCRLNEAGDRDPLDYDIWGVDILEGEPVWIVYGTYDKDRKTITWHK